MNDIQVTAQFEEDVRRAMLLPAMPEAAIGRLQKQLAARANEMDDKQARPYYRRPGWTVAMAVLLILMVTILVLGPQRVVAAMLDLLSYVPGYGFVHEGDLRVLKEPVEQERDGITVAVNDALSDDQHLWLMVYVSGIGGQHMPEAEQDAGCTELPTLRLSDGSLIRPQWATGTSGQSWTQVQIAFPVISPDQNAVTLVLSCVMGLRQDVTPGNWELPLEFEPAAADYPAYPLSLLPTPMPGEASVSENGIVLSVASMAELEDGYLVQGYLSWEGTPYKYVFLNEFDFSATDVEGKPVAIEPILNAYGLETPPNSQAWTVRTQGKEIAWPVTFTLPAVQVSEIPEQSEPVYFEVDLGDAPENGQVWQLDQTLAWEGYEVKVVDVTFVDTQSGFYMINIRMQIDDGPLRGVSLIDPDNQSEERFGGGGGGGGSDSTVIEFVQGIGYSYLPQGLRRFQITSYSHLLDEQVWSVTMDLPAP